MKNIPLYIFCLMLCFICSCSSKKIFVSSAQSNIGRVYEIEKKEGYEKQLFLKDGTTLNVQGIDQIYPTEVHFIMENGKIGKYSINVIEQYQLKRKFKIGRGAFVGITTIGLGLVFLKIEGNEWVDWSTNQLGGSIIAAGVSSFFIGKNRPKTYKVYFFEFHSEVQLVETVD